MTENEIFDSAIEKWRLSRGIGTFICEFPYNKSYPVQIILSKIYSKSPECKTLIIVSNFDSRKKIIELLNSSFSVELNAGNIKVLSQSYVEIRGNGQGADLTICYGITSMSDNMINILNNSNYKLIILHRMLNTELMNKIYFIAPLIKNFGGKAVKKDYSNSPVEEVLVGLSLNQSSQEYKLLQYYNKEIENAISIFNDFDTIKKARIGDASTNISATSICYEIAKQNGWNENLDMSTPISQEIDKYYNPIAIHERAENVYNIIRSRANLLTDDKSKLDKVEEIIKENNGKRILIISKRGEFASMITNHLNEKFIDCLNYHDKVEPIVATDDNGNVLYYKSGSKKGEIRYYASKRQMTVAQKKFRNGDVKILSANNSPNKDLSVAIDVVIITSPICLDIREILYRLSECKFAEPVKVYTLYINNSLEAKKIDKRIPDRHRHITKVGASDIDFECDDFVLVN